MRVNLINENNLHIYQIFLKRIQRWWNFGRSCKIWRLRWRKCWLGSLHLWTSRKAIKRRLLFPRSWSRWARSGSENINFLFFWLINFKLWVEGSFSGFGWACLTAKRLDLLMNFAEKHRKRLVYDLRKIKNLKNSL